VAQGGFVRAGNLDVLTGRAAAGFDAQFRRQFTQRMEASMTSAMQQAIAQAQAALRRLGGPGGPGIHAAIPYLEHLWVNAGGPPGLAHLMAAIAMAESGGRSNAYNKSGASGLWQILGAVDPRDQPFLFNPVVNAHEAVLKWRSQGLGAWEAYTNGAYRAFYAKGGLVKSYDQGGFLPPGASIAVNTTGAPEAVVPMAKGGFVQQLHHA